MRRSHSRLAILGALAAATALTVVAASADETTGITDKTIKIGNIMPYSGPASAYSQIAKADAAYMKMLNDKGGVCGRQIDFISYDDGYSPPKTVEQARKLVESDQVELIFKRWKSGHIFQV